jgi:hypothetical protein
VPRTAAPACASQGHDTDQDGVTDLVDVCPLLANPGQQDADHDGRGDICDDCPSVPNPQQTDTDGNVLGDNCQDADNDGFRRATTRSGHPPRAAESSTGSMTTATVSSTVVEIVSIARRPGSSHRHG